MLWENGTNRTALGQEVVALLEAGIKANQYVLRREGARPGLVHAEYLEMKAAVEQYEILRHRGDA